MADPQLYDQYFAYLNGALLAENTSLDIELRGDDQEILTTAKGFAGLTPSPRSVMITAENVVPPTGFEFDAFQKFLDSELVEMKVQSGATGKTLVSKGFIQAPKVQGGVGKTVSLSFTFKGGPSKFE